ncbi:MAG: glycosyltransferase [Flavobacteriales bacterium]|nr:glycosyltransferase [Flavobacteriales bacterium]MCB9205112.1 glycosyltransferase [Flavobacteriales bacterium]
MAFDVTVVVATYNHEKYVRDALASIFSQRVEGLFVNVLVLDDGSSDRTIKIVQNTTCPPSFTINILSSNTNNGVLRNVKRATNYIQGRYVAFLDGDDFWTDADKLCTQIRFLDENIEYNGCFHDAQIEHVDQLAEQHLFRGKLLYSHIYEYTETIRPNQLLNRLIIPSSSLVLRIKVFDDPGLSLIDDNYSILWKLECIAIKSSLLHYVDRSWSVYRNHDGGISKSLNLDFHLSHLRFLKCLLKDDYYRNTKYDVWRSIEKEARLLLNKYSSELDGKRFLSVFLLALHGSIQYYFLLGKEKFTNVWNHWTG